MQRHLFAAGAIIASCLVAPACGDFADFDRRMRRPGDTGSPGPDGGAPRPSLPSAPTPDSLAATPDSGPPPGACGSPFETEVFTLTNQQRAQHGLPALTCDAKAGAVARQYSELMCQTGHFDHFGPDGSSPFERLKKGGVSFTAVGENIAAGAPSPSVVMNGWMNSPGHRSNILSTLFTHIGVGYAACSGGLMHTWTQSFFR